MKKLLLLVFLCCCFLSHAQTLDWAWARSAQSSALGSGEGLCVATDHNGNAFMAGFFLDTLTIGSYVMPANYYSGYVAKYDTYGTLLWAVSNTCLHDLSECYPQAVCTDKWGNCFLTGYFKDTVAFGAFTLISAGGFDIFLVKYDPSGNVLWAKRGGGALGDYGAGIATDDSGNVFMSGYFNSTTLAVGSITLTNAGNFDGFLAKYDSAGNVLWALKMGNTGYDRAGGVATDARGNAYVTGYFVSASITIGSNTFTNAGSADIFFIKYDPAGNVLWAKNAGGTITDEGSSVTVDSSGNVYFIGNFNSAAVTFGTHTINTTGLFDIFIVKYDSSGNALWAKDVGTASNDYGYTIAADRNRRIYLTGSFTSNQIILDTINLQRPAASNDPMFISCFDSTGHTLWALALPSGGDDNSGVAVGPSGCIYICGDFYRVNPFILGNDSLWITGGENAFFAKLCNNILTSSFTASDNTICAEGNNCINFTDYSGGNPTSWQWSFSGGTPSSSTVQNPTTICYSTPGTYPVTLIVGNGTSSDTLTVANMIIVGGTPPLPVISVVGGDTLVCSPATQYQWYLNGNVIAGATDSIYVEHQNGIYSVQITDGYGCQAVSAGVDVGVEEMSGGGGIVVYPNPADDQFTVYDLRFTKDATVGVYNVLGEKIYSSSISKKQETINIKDFPAGVYFVTIQTSNSRVVKKVVKE